MENLPLPERLTRIEDEIALLDSSLDAKTRELWQAFDMLRAQVDDLRNQVERPRTR
jgi:flagellar capping protein FliD